MTTEHDIVKASIGNAVLFRVVMWCLDTARIYECCRVIKMPASVMVSAWRCCLFENNFHRMRTTLDWSRHISDVIWIIISFSTESKGLISRLRLGTKRLVMFQISVFCTIVSEFTTLVSSWQGFHIGAACILRYNNLTVYATLQCLHFLLPVGLSLPIFFLDLYQAA